MQTIFLISKGVENPFPREPQGHCQAQGNLARQEEDPCLLQKLFADQGVRSEEGAYQGFLDCLILK